VTRLRIKNFMRERISLSTTGEETLLSVSEYYGVRPRTVALDTDDYISRSESLEGYRRVFRHDLVMNYMLAWKGAYGVSEYEGIVSPAYAVFEIDQQQADVRYIHHRLRSLDMQAIFTSRSKGIIQSRLRLYPDAFLALQVELPDLDTQKAIADFLDRETARVDQLIEKKERVLRLLGEQRLSAVAKATDRTGPLTKLGHHVTILPGYAFSSEQFSSDADDVRLLRGVNVTPGAIRWDDVVYWPSTKLKDIQHFMLKVGDVVLGMDRPWISSGIRLAELTSADTPSLLLQRVCRISPRNTLDKDYKKLLLISPRFLAHFAPILTGVSVPHISGDQIAAFRFHLISIREQQSATKECEQTLAKIRRLEKKVLQSVDHLHELRSVLITAAVTGRIDLTSWGKQGNTDQRLDAIQEILA
jgi:type I restriction enzyme S subunit